MSWRGRVVVLVVAALALVSCGGDDGETAGAGGSTAGAPVDGIEGVVAIPAQSREHVESPVDYPSSPPAGGAHFPVWQNCGFYEVPVNEETVVHSLEHGAVWFTYRPDVPAEQLDALRQRVEGESHVLASPYEQSSPFVLTAWERQLAVDDLADPRVEQFVSTYLGKGPEPGAPCSGGIGIPPGDAVGVP